MNQTTSDFKSYGEVASLTKTEADPVISCLESTKYNVDPSNPLRYQKGLCDSWMAQRCSRGWDRYCEIYLGDRKNQDFTGKATNQWLLEALEAKFCRVDANAPGSYCYEKCDQMDPLAPAGAQVCKTMGDIVYRDSNKLYNIDTNYNWSNTLTAPSPIKFTSCKKVCDVFTLADFDENDRILNECLDRGIGTDILQNLAQNLVANRVPVRNSRLRAFIERYVIGSKQNGQLTPGFSSIGQAPVITNIPIATPAVNTYLPPGSIYTVADVGNVGNEPTKYEMGPSAATSPSVRKMKVRREPLLRKKNSEQFSYLPNVSSEMKENLTWVIVIVLVFSLIGVIKCQLFDKRKK